jgi:hypothetical protein
LLVVVVVMPADCCSAQQETHKQPPRQHSSPADAPAARAVGASLSSLQEQADSMKSQLEAQQKAVDQLIANTR